MATLRLLAAWLLVLWLFFTLTNYAPSRYFLMFYLALAALAAYTLLRAEEVFSAVAETPLYAAAAAGLLTYELQKAVLQSGLQATRAPLFLLAAIAVVAGLKARRYRTLPDESGGHTGGRMAGSNPGSDVRALGGRGAGRIATV